MPHRRTLIPPLFLLGFYVGLWSLVVHGHALPRPVTQLAPAVAGRPIVPYIPAGMQAHLATIHAAGQARGNVDGVFIKVGDSISASPFFLQDFACSDGDLAADPALRATLAYFRAIQFSPGTTQVPCGVSDSFSRMSYAAATGWSSVEVIQPLAPAPPDCPAPDNTPLRCEIRRLHPSFALIMVGTNDLGRDNGPTDLADYQNRLTAIVTQTMAAGVVPILSTIPPRHDIYVLGARVLAYNAVITQVADDAQVPLWNYWRALVDVDTINEGLSADGIHPSAYACPRCLPLHFADDGLRYGYNLRNWTALQVLAHVKAVVLDGRPPDPPRRAPGRMGGLFAQ